MIAGFNIGNTHTIMGIYEEGNPEPIYTYRYTTSRYITSQELSDTISKGCAEYHSNTLNSIQGAIYSSVVPQCNEVYDSTCTTLFGTKPIRISHTLKMPITIEYDNPAQLGVDRIVNAVAACTDYATDCIIVDIGTAITFCLLQNNVLKGGLIAPGVKAAMKGLAQSTAQLFEVPFEKPDDIIAHNTKNALISGFFYGWISLIEGIVHKIQAVYPVSAVLLTGGMAGAIHQHISLSAITDPSLTMRGLYYLYNINA